MPNKVWFECSMARLVNASADIDPRWVEACWVASRGLPVAYSALFGAALIVNSFAVLLVLASWAAWGVPAYIEICLMIADSLMRD